MIHTVEVLNPPSDLAEAEVWYSWIIIEHAEAIEDFKPHSQRIAYPGLNPISWLL